MLTDFQTFFTVGLSSDCAMNWSLKIPSHLKRVDTLPCKTIVFQNWSTLINTSCSLFVVCHELINRIIVFSDIWSDLVIYPAISRYHFKINLGWLLSFARAVSTLTFCASFVPPVRKCNNVRDPQNCQTSGHRTALASIHFITKSGAASLPQKRRMWKILGGICLMRELECNRALLMMALISGARLHAYIRAI